VLVFAATLSSIAACGRGRSEKAERTGRQAQVRAFPDSIPDTAVLAEIGDRTVTGRDLRIYEAIFVGGVSPHLPPAERHRQALEQLIDREILWMEGRAQGLVATDSMVQATLADISRSMGGQERLVALLGQRGIDENELESIIRKDLVIQQFLDRSFRPGLKVTDEEARRYYDEHPEFFSTPDTIRARHILVQVPPDASPEERVAKRKRIREIQQELRQGTDFATAAKLYSDDASTRERGGDLGYIVEHTVIQPFDSVAFSLKVGEVSDLVETPFGYHLIQVEERHPGKTLSFEEVRPQLIQRLEGMRLAEAIQKHLQEARDSLTIVKRYE
jgi:peptidyl-prolyl cis-trans isomerase C